MQATPVRARFGSAFEWFVAALFLLADACRGLLIARELSIAPPRAGQRRAAPAAVLPAAVPARAFRFRSCCSRMGGSARWRHAGAVDRLTELALGGRHGRRSTAARSAIDSPGSTSTMARVRARLRAVRTRRRAQGGWDLSALRQIGQRCRLQATAAASLAGALRGAPTRRAATVLVA